MLWYGMSAEILYFSNEELSCGPLPRLLRSWCCVRIFNTDRSFLVRAAALHAGTRSPAHVVGPSAQMDFIHGVATREYFRPEATLPPAVVEREMLQFPPMRCAATRACATTARRSLTSCASSGESFLNLADEVRDKAKRLSTFAPGRRPSVVVVHTASPTGADAPDAEAHVEVPTAAARRRPGSASISVPNTSLVVQHALAALQEPDTPYSGEVELPTLPTDHGLPHNVPEN
jgi:hypothetical protein